MSLDTNCTQNMMDGSGKVVGVSLSHFALPDSKYRLARCSLRDEYAAQGQTIARVTAIDKHGVPQRGRVALLWPYNGNTDFGHSAVTNDVTPIEHMISNAYTPPNVGPLAIAILDDDGFASDVVAGLGLPYGHHVSFDIVFQERGADVDPTDDLDDDEHNDLPVVPQEDILAALIAIRNGVDSIIDALEL